MATLADISLAAEEAELEAIVTVKEAAAFCRVSTRTIGRWIASGRLRATKSHPARSGRVLIVRHSLLKLLAHDIS